MPQYLHPHFGPARELEPSLRPRYHLPWGTAHQEVLLTCGYCPPEGTAHLGVLPMEKVLPTWRAVPAWAYCPPGGTVTHNSPLSHLFLAGPVQGMLQSSILVPVPTDMPTVLHTYTHIFVSNFDFPPACFLPL